MAQTGLPLGLVFAGLLSAVSDLLDEDMETFAGAGFSIEPALIQTAAEATCGYPFLI